ncbi:hypothetical protein V6Z12_D03G197500 [Gossypium hirsutum]
MLRSSCSNRVSSELFLNSPDSQSLSSNQHGSETVLLDKQLLPIYNPLSRAAEKERSHLRSAENAVHIIPFVLVFCGFILWLFSSIGLKYHPLFFIYFLLFLRLIVRS